MKPSKLLFSKPENFANQIIQALRFNSDPIQTPKESTQMISRVFAIILMMSAMSMAQMPVPPVHEPGGAESFHAPFHGGWWENPELVQKVGLSENQVQQLDKISQDARIRMIDLRANVERAEAVLQPMIEASNSDEAVVLGQIDKVATQHAELEKARVQTLFALRRVLTPEQLKQLRALSHTSMGQRDRPMPPPELHDPMSRP